MVNVVYNEDIENVVDFDRVDLETKEFEDFFINCFGYKLKSIQRSYVRRVFLNMSFSFQAPTGTGKTVLGIFLCLYFSLVKDKKCLLIFPTQLLVKQSYDIFMKYSEKIRNYLKERYNKELLSDKILFFLSQEKKSIKDETILKIGKGDYNFLSITNNFLARNFELLRKNIFNIIFVDDLDSISRGSRNTEKILMLLGFDQDFIKEVKNRNFVLTEEQKEKLKTYPKNILIISSATFRKGINTILFSKLLSFDVGSSINFVRNIEDIFVGNKDISKLLFILDRMGPGGIIFTSSLEEAKELEKIIPNSKVITSKSVKYVDKLIDLYDFQDDIDFLNNEENEEIVFDEGNLNTLNSGNNLGNIEDIEDIEGIEDIEDIDLDSLEAQDIFENGENVGNIENSNGNNNVIDNKESISYLIGVASPYSILTRGLDLPYKIRYVVFWGIPKRKIDLNALDSYRNIYPIQKVLSFIFFKRKMVSLDRIKEYIDNLEDRLVLGAFIIINKVLYSIDIKTYLQASGRCSRITPFGITKGVSFVFDDEIFLEPFKKIAYFSNLEIKESLLNDQSLEYLKSQVDESRTKVLGVNGYNNVSNEIDFKSYLMVVESPTKAKQIANMFGIPSIIRIDIFNGYEVFSPIGVLIIVPSLGHVAELSIDEENVDKNGKLNLYNVIIELSEDKKVRNCSLIYSSIKRCRKCGRSFASKEKKCIYCGNEDLYSSFKYLEKLKIISYLVDGVILATDPDSEGEKISYDIAMLLKPKVFYRVTFNEITKRAVTNALNDLKDINLSMVHSQLVRRIEDRWLGFSLSAFLREELDDRNLSAGRVQSPVLNWIVKRYEEYNKKVNFAIVNDPKIGVLQFMNSGIKGNAKLKVEIISKQEKEVVLPPFNTPDILAFANSVLKLSSNETMNLLQKLFENGLITYHRTESYSISNVGIEIAKEIFVKRGMEFIYRNFEKSLHAHEAIRITKPLDVEDIKLFYQDRIPFQAFRLYDMIYKRFLNAFAKPTKLVVYSYKFVLFNDIEESVVYQDRVVDIIGPNIFPYVSNKSEVVNEGIFDVKVSNIKKSTVTLYSQSDIVKLMKEKEIGRPSTYAHIISRLFSRGYIIEKYNRIIPMKKGIVVNEKLNTFFPDLISEDRTRDLQKKMDLIEEGYKSSIEVINELYEELNSKIFLRLTNLA